MPAVARKTEGSLSAPPASSSLAGNGHPENRGRNALHIGRYALSVNLKGAGEPGQDPPKYLIKLSIWHAGDCPPDLREPAWGDGIEVIADRPTTLPVNRHRHRPGPRAVALGLCCCRDDQARAVQAVLVGDHHHGAGFPHLRQLGIKPEVAPVDLPMLGRGHDPGLNARRG